MASSADVRNALIAALAETFAAKVEKIEAQVAAAGGDDSLRLRSKIAEAVIARLERIFGMTLPGPADLDRTQYATVGALVRMLAPLLRNA